MIRIGESAASSSKHFSIYVLASASVLRPVEAGELDAGGFWFQMHAGGCHMVSGMVFSAQLEK